MINKVAGLIMIGCVSGFSYADCVKTVIFVRHGEKNQTTPHGQLNCQGLNRALALSDVLMNRYGTPAAIYASNPGVTVSDDSNTCYNYQRPLATIEPTAIALNLPVISTYGIGSIGGPSSPEDTVTACASAPVGATLQLPQSPTPPSACGEGISSGDADIARDILNTSAYCNQTIFVAWEHRNIPIIVYSFYKILGLNPVNAIPLWPYGPCLVSYQMQGFCTVGNCSANYNYDTIYAVTINQNNASPTIQIALSSENLDGQPITCPT